MQYSNHQKQLQEGTKMSLGHTDVPPNTQDKIQHGSNCPSGVREVLSLVGDKWSMQIVGALCNTPIRFNELRRSIDGISQRMLTRTLRELERSGLVSRTVTPTTPPSVEYALTPFGKTLIEPVKALADWAEKNYPTMSKAQERYDKNVK